MKISIKKKTCVALLFAAAVVCAGGALFVQSCQKGNATNLEGKYKAVHPGVEMYDTNGNRVQAHGHSVIYSDKDKCYYWYGEDKSKTIQGNNVWTWGVRCYRSKDFYNWEDMGHLILPDTVDVLSPIHFSQGLDRPHIIYCPHTDKWLCWIKNISYERQFFTILQADDFFGPYELINRGFFPNGFEAGDFDLYYDEDTDKAYVWFERPHWELMTMELTDDFTGVKPDAIAHNFVGKVPPYTPEAPAHFVRNGKHYIFASGTTGYFPNESMVITFDDYMGEYKMMGNPHPSDTTHTSFFSQITDVIKIPGKKDLYVACADRWIPSYVGTDIPNQKFKWFEDLFRDHQPNDVSNEEVLIKDRSGWKREDHDATYDGRYVWLPIRFDENDMPIIEWKDEWRIEDYE